MFEYCSKLQMLLCVWKSGSSKMYVPCKQRDLTFNSQNQNLKNVESDGLCL